MRPVSWCLSRIFTLTFDFSPTPCLFTSAFAFMAFSSRTWVWKASGTVIISCAAPVPSSATAIVKIKVTNLMINVCELVLVSSISRVWSQTQNRVSLNFNCHHLLIKRKKNVVRSNRVDEIYAVSLAQGDLGHLRTRYNS